MKHRKWPICIWFLDKDLQKSASFLTDRLLMKSIDGCLGALLSSYFYIIGIRSKKFYDYFFSKEHVDETMCRFFPNWPLKKKPSFSAYRRKESKWCRMCYENWAYAKCYLKHLLDESEWRTGTVNESAKVLDWIEYDMPSISLPSANLNEVYLPWKSIEPRFRRVDVIEGYRLQFMSTFEDNDPFKAYGACKRDIPDFVLQHFNLQGIYER